MYQQNLETPLKGDDENMSCQTGVEADIFKDVLIPKIAMLSKLHTKDPNLINKVKENFSSLDICKDYCLNFILTWKNYQQ